MCWHVSSFGQLIGRLEEEVARACSVGVGVHRCRVTRVAPSIGRPHAASPVLAMRWANWPRVAALGSVGLGYSDDLDDGSIAGVPWTFDHAAHCFQAMNDPQVD